MGYAFYFLGSTIMEKTKKTVLDYEENENNEFEEKNNSSKNEIEEGLTFEKRLINFILSGCQFNTTYFMMNYASNGYKIDEQTKYEYCYTYLKSQTNLK